MAVYLTEADVAGLVGIDDAIAALDSAFAQWGRDGTANLPRQRLPLPRRSLNLMTASLPSEGVFGHKAYFSGCQLFSLFSIPERRLLALMEAGTLGALRTGAASGIATRLLARPDARTVGLIGSGRQARTQLMAVCAVRGIEAIRVFSRSAESRRSFAGEMTKALGISVEPVEDAERCVRGADIVIAATGAAEPVVKGAWLAPGCHVNAIGANAYARRELDDEAVLRAALVATDDRDQARIEARELIDLAKAGRIAWDDVVELGAVLQGKLPGRAAEADITVFKSLGVALEDVAFGHVIYRRAVEQGAGRDLGPIPAPANADDE